MDTIFTSSELLFALAAAAVELFVGIAVGYWLRGGKSSPGKNQPAEEHQLADRHTADLREAEHALSNLQELAERVKADVGAHSSQVEAISSQLNDEQSTGSGKDAKVLDAVSKILAANQALEERLHSAESKLQQQAEQIKVHAANALTDALTSLGNRRAFDAELPKRISDFERHATPFCLVMLDVDHFKKFNDVHGHLAGDEVLRMVGRTLKATVRTPDFVARYGGEEFGIVMPKTTVAEAVESAQRVRAGIEQASCEFEDKKLNVTVSIGVAEFAARQTPSGLVQCADEALYAAKQAGRNQVQRYHAAEAAIVEPTPPPSAVPNRVDDVATIQTPSAPQSVGEMQTAGDMRTDVQTGLPNRTAFCEDIHRRLSEAHRHGTRLSLMLIHIDHYDDLAKRQDGHFVGLVLRTCTQFLSAAMREMDLVARYNRDVFGIVLPGTALVHATGAGERLRSAIEHCPLRSMDQDIRFTISAGVAEAQPGEDLVSLISRTEEARLEAEADGGNKVRFHSGSAVESLPQDSGATA